MKIGPTIFGLIKGGSITRIRDPRLPGIPLAGTKGRSKRAGLVPLHLYLKRQRYLESFPPWIPHDTECCVFKYVDSLYQKFTPGQKAEWAAAVKRPRYSPYDLWMSEALYLCLQGLRPPDHPSISGGFNPRKASPGILYDIAPCWPTIPDMAESLYYFTSVTASVEVFGASHRITVRHTHMPPPGSALPPRLRWRSYYRDDSTHSWTLFGNNQWNVPTQGVLFPIDDPYPTTFYSDLWVTIPSYLFGLSYFTMPYTLARPWSAALPNFIPWSAAPFGLHPPILIPWPNLTFIPPY